MQLETPGIKKEKNESYADYIAANTAPKGK